MADWLEVPQVVALLELPPEDTSEDEAWLASFEGALAAARSYVEDNRADLFNGDTPREFQPGPDVKYGTALLAYRWKKRAGSSLGVAEYSEFGSGLLRHDPDIAKMLGIGTEGAFVFGAGTRRRCS